MERARAALRSGLPPAEERWGDLAPGDEEFLGEPLDLAAVFDVHVTLDEPGEHIRDLPGRSTGPPGGIGSGAAFSVGRKPQAASRKPQAASRKPDTGRLPAAYAVLVGLPVRERGAPVRYRAEPDTADELLAAWLPPEDEAAAAPVREARERCARRDTTGSRPGPSPRRRPRAR
ncbi:hypothetical protein [Streptomyces sp. NRRL F-2580]|uniref:hypothetical protein n=1 Tax=Streptomyces sp. NRRL F-2580 TaxID=1463841 RepID=UPI0004CBEB7D|nr:hypothetical protein [Streptomyces sp. NRRL F-2580]